MSDEIKEVKKKKPKLTPKQVLVNELTLSADKIKNAVETERGKSLNTSSCAMLNKAYFDIKNIIRKLG